MTNPRERSRWDRRAWLGTGALGLAGTSAVLYKAAPGFWQQYTRELKRPIAPPTLTPDPSKWPDRGLFAAWIGHSTVLLKMDGVTILTDPVFSKRAGVHIGVTTIGVKRLIEPALEVRKVPKVDLILLSHAHMDHFDLPSLRVLESKKTTVITAPKTSDLLRVGQYAATHELAWDESRRVGAVTVRGIEVNHWGARVRTDLYRGYNGYLIEAGRYRVLFGGDTANTDLFKKIAGNRSIDLAVMPIGAYNPWIRFHCTPEEAWRMAREARADRFLPVHHSTFQLGREPLSEPMERLVHIAGRDADQIVLHRIGEEWSWT